MEELMEYFGQIHSFEQICNFKGILDKSIIKFDESLLSYLTEELQSSYTDEQQIINMNLILHIFEKCLEINYSSIEWYNMGDKLVNIIKTCFTKILNFVGTPFSESYSFDTFVKKCLTVFLSFVNYDNNLKNNLLTNISGPVLSLISNENAEFFVRVEALKQMLPLIAKCDVKTKKIILRSNIRVVRTVVMWFLSCGDFETQETLLGFFVRITCMFKVKVYQLVVWLKDYKELAAAANNLDADNFYPSCRIFLNIVNSTVNPKFKVLTLPCVTVFAENYQLTKPDDILYTDFWMDYSTASGRIHLVYSVACGSWSKLSISHKEVKSVSSKRLKWGESHFQELLISLNDAVKVLQQQKKTVEVFWLKIHFKDDDKFERLQKEFLYTCYTGKYVVLGDKSCSHHSKSAVLNVSNVNQILPESALKDTKKNPFSFLDVSLSTIKTNTTIQQTANQKKNGNLAQFPDSDVDHMKEELAKRRNIIASTPLVKRICLAEPKIKLRSELNLQGTTPSSSFTAQNKAGFCNKFIHEEENIEISRDRAVLKTSKTGGTPWTSIPGYARTPRTEINNSRASLDRYSSTGLLMRDQYMSEKVDHDFQDMVRKYQKNELAKENCSKVLLDEFSRTEKTMKMLHSSKRQVNEDAPLRCNEFQTSKTLSPLQNGLLTEGEGQQQAVSDKANTFNRLDFSMAFRPDKTKVKPVGEEDSFRNLLKQNENGERINEFAKKLVAWGKQSTGRVTLVRPPEDSREAGIENNCSISSETPLLLRLNKETKSENKTSRKTLDRPQSSLSDSFSVFKSDMRECKPLRTYTKQQRQTKTLHWQSSNGERSEAKPKQVTQKLDHKVFAEKCTRSQEKKRKLYNSNSRCEYEFEASKSDVKMAPPVSSRQESKHDPVPDRKIFKGQNRKFKREVDQVKDMLVYEHSSGPDCIEDSFLKKSNRQIYTRQKKQEAKMRIRRNITGVVSERGSLRKKSYKNYQEQDSNDEVEQIEPKKINLFQKKQSQKPPVVDTARPHKEKEANPQQNTRPSNPKADTVQSNYLLDPRRFHKRNEITFEAPTPKVVAKDFMKLKSPPECKLAAEISRPISPSPVTVPEVLSSPLIIDPSPEAGVKFPKAVCLAVSFGDIATKGSLVQNTTVSKTLDTPNNRTKLKLVIDKTEPMEEIYKLGKELKTLERHESPIEMLTKIKQLVQDSLTKQEARAVTLRNACMDLLQRNCDSWKGDLEKGLATIDSIQDAWYQSIQKSKEKEENTKANLLKKVQNLLQSLPERRRKEVEANMKTYLELLGLNFPK